MLITVFPMNDFGAQHVGKSLFMQTRKQVSGEAEAEGDIQVASGCPTAL